MATSLAFRLPPSPPKFAPRLGLFSLTRANSDGGSSRSIEIATPGIMVCTTRGVVQHLSRDNVRRTSSIKWIHVPFESFLQIDPPIPTLHTGGLHSFLGFPPAQTILSMSLRDPADGREMPANGKLFVAAQSLRGTRKVTCPAYRSYVATTLPDIVFPLSDVPFTPPPHSQKRIIKSIERSRQWLASILAPLDLHNYPQNLRLNVFLHMVGGINPAARAAFAAALQEPLEQKEKEALAPFETLDDGVAGYAFDLVPLRTALLAESVSPSLDTLATLIRASLEGLPSTKPRLATAAHSPHEILTLVRDAGVDLFDTQWAQRAATWGVALDFAFPAPKHPFHGLGHNLYDARYACDFAALSEVSCQCAACAPMWVNAPLVHSVVDLRESKQPERAEAYKRAYVHHLLHTHEMSAHALLVMHNITIMDKFMYGIREVLQRESEGEEGRFAREVARFEEAYDGALRVLDEARKCWADVDLARGKGRLARERARKAAEELGVDVKIGASFEVEKLEE